jgi:outer membrane protein W
MLETRYCLACAAIALPFATPVAAQKAGDIQVKAFVTGVLPDGAIAEVETDLIGLPLGCADRSHRVFRFAELLA